MSKTPEFKSSMVFSTNLCVCFRFSWTSLKCFVVDDANVIDFKSGSWTNLWSANGQLSWMDMTTESVNACTKNMGVLINLIEFLATAQRCAFRLLPRLMHSLGNESSARQNFKYFFQLVSSHGINDGFIWP